MMELLSSQYLLDEQTNHTCTIFSSAVPSSSRVFQMPTRPSSSASSASSSSAAASTLRGKGPISETLQ